MLVRCVPKSNLEVHSLMDRYGKFDACPASANLEKDPRHKPVPLSKTNSHGKQPEHYLEATLASDAVGFFLLTCNGPGYTVIPFNPGKRFYQVDGHNGYPPDPFIRTLQQRDIWVVRSWLDVTRKINAMADPNEKRVRLYAFYERRLASPCEQKAMVSHENHWNPGRYSLPNTADERYQTFTEHHRESKLCRMLLKTPELLRHYVDEGLFFSGNYTCGQAYSSILQAQAAAPGLTGLEERLTCAFCMKNSRFSETRTIEISQKKPKSPIDAENIIRTYLSKGQLCSWKLHDQSCFNSLYRDKPLVQVIDAEGNARAYQMYFIADPVHESGSKVANRRDRSCPYVRAFVLHPHDTQKTGSLFVSRRELTEIIHQENNRERREMIHDSALWVSTALESAPRRLQPPESLYAVMKFNEKLKEATEAYQAQYASSALCLELATYKTLWQQLPAPLSPTEQVVYDFLVKANKRFCHLYTWSHLTNELMLLKNNIDINCACVLDPIIKKMAQRRERARNHLQQSLNMHSSAPCPAWPLAMTRLATPFSWEKLQSHNPCFRQISESGTEILAQLQKLTL
ncbi:hypothetical protein [Endozoicomonas sp. SESOKO1]|uniref:hypothetical protein n=1 Tax=Endozoicomonas sp. SESOKO1 TaxID=2828742 RepID=UPI002147BC8A|nr:hypothetical protein [Endozoicomonas sp. SESOKO1]